MTTGCAACDALCAAMAMLVGYNPVQDAGHSVRTVCPQCLALPNQNVRVQQPVDFSAG